MYASERTSGTAAGMLAPLPEDSVRGQTGVKL